MQLFHVGDRTDVLVHLLCELMMLLLLHMLYLNSTHWSLWFNHSLIILTFLQMRRLKLRKNNWSSESYRFDEIFTQSASQKRVYEAVAKPVVEVSSKCIAHFVCSLLWPWSILDLLEHKWGC